MRTCRGAGQPAFYIATRRVCYFHVRVQTGERDLHSGSFGGAALSATHAAAADALGGPRRPDGRLPEPLRAGVVPPTEQELADWRPSSRARGACGPGRRPDGRAAADEFYVRTWAEPSVDVNGVAGGSPQLQKTVIPVVREANVSIRLAAGQTVEEIAPEVERLLRESAPEGPRSRSSCCRQRRPGLIPPDSAAIRLGQDAFERAVGRGRCCCARADRCRSSPRSPTGAFRTIVTGFEPPRGNLHSPNERLLVEHVPLGVAAAQELFRSLAGLVLGRAGDPGRGRASRGRSGASPRSPAAGPAPSASARTRPSAASRVAVPVTTPSSSEPAQPLDSVRGLIPGQECSSSEKPAGPSDMSCTSSAVHFEPMISAEHATAQVASCTGFIVRTAMFRL
jgi:hypothetical protein